MGTWVEIPLAGELNKNVSGVMLRARAAEMQNAYLNEAGGLSRFPQLTTFCEMPVSRQVYLEEWRGDMIAVCGGRSYRVGLETAVPVDITGAAVEGGKRVIFTKTEDELVMAAGRQIACLRGLKTELLSDEAPESTHVAWASGYLVAIEKDSGRFQFSPAQSLYRTWNPLDVFSAEGKSDNITAALVTETGELLLAGPESIEQHDPSPSGDKPFYRRWMLGAGLYAPYTFVSVDDKTWGVNNQKEFVGFSTQLGAISSGQIQKKLEQIDDWAEAFSFELPIDGQRFIVLQMPHATNDYGTKGVTFLYDYKRRHWAELYGFSEELRLPERWQGWSYLDINDRKFVGGNGRIYELGGYAGESVQKMLWRSGHIQLNGGGKYSIEKLHMRVARGGASVGASAPIISMRINKDNRGFGRYLRRDLGQAGKSHMHLNFGNMGQATSFQFEVEVTDNIATEIAECSIYVERMDE